MRRLFFAAFFATPIFAFGQLKMDQSGNIGIGTTVPSSRLEVNNGDLTIKAGASSANDPGDLVFKSATGDEYGRIFTFWNAMRFRAHPASSGSINIMRAGGNVSIQMLTASNSYSLDVWGLARSPYFHSTSDRKFKSNIIQLPSSRVTDLYNLNGYTYSFQMAKYGRACDGVKADSTSNYDGAKDVESIGIIAQEVQEYFPELVNEDENGILAVNYDGFIPILIESVKEQKLQIEQLKNKIEQMSLSGNSESVSRTVLHQNVPNPFDDITEISYEIPSPFESASINVYDLSGKQLISLDLENARGKVMINQGDLYKGLFIYNLVVNGQEIASKKMIVQ